MLEDIGTTITVIYIRQLNNEKICHNYNKISCLMAVTGYGKS
jgi:hypothetical protein